MQDKIKNKKQTKSNRPQKTNRKEDLKKKPKNNSGKIIIISSIVLAVFLIFLCIKSKYRKSPFDNDYRPFEPIFKKEGRLSFLKKTDKSKIKEIDIEVANNEDERAMGLMWRKSMADSLGMLFIFGEEKPLSFWMKNTFIPLDIIYADKTGKIVAIQRETKPLNEDPLPSVKPATYVVEVNADFCKRYNIQEGDLMKFDLAKN